MRFGPEPFLTVGLVPRLRASNTILGQYPGFGNSTPREILIERKTVATHVVVVLANHYLSG